MSKLYLIHPAVGCARMGNSINGVQIAPEVPYSPSIGSFMDVIQNPVIKQSRPDLLPNPRADSFRGADGNIRRQGVRYRIFEYEYETIAGSDILKSCTEVTTATFDIEWTVELANKKAKDWSLLTALDSSGHINEDKVHFQPNNNVATATVTAVQITNEQTPVRELWSTNRLKLGGIVVQSTGQMILIGSAGATNMELLPTTAPKLEGIINRGWEDDAADGPVKAKIKRKGTSQWIDIGDQGTSHFSGNAWAIVGPPRFGGDINPIVSLHDVALSLATRGKPYLVGTDKFYTRYKRDIYPILRGMDLVAQVHVSEGKHDSAGNSIYIPNNHHALGQPMFLDPETSMGLGSARKKLILARLTPPDDVVKITNPYPTQAYYIEASTPNSLGLVHPILHKLTGTSTNGMPRLYGLSLTHLQYEHIKNWVDDHFINDWASVPHSKILTPSNIDQAQMRSICGGTFIPGIEVGKNVWNSAIWSFRQFLGEEPLVRLNTKLLQPGDLTITLGVPWQYDYADCQDNWWPASRPISLLVNSLDPTGQQYRWHSKKPKASYPDGADFPLKHVWKELGYMMLQNSGPKKGSIEEMGRTADKPTYNP